MNFPMAVTTPDDLFDQGNLTALINESLLKC